MAIPRVIHYCWFGEGNLPELERSCMATWSDLLCGFEIKRWDESNVDLDRIPYVRQAYDRGKYAFVSDVVRLLALYEFGGIYLDTDVEVLRPLDDLLSASAFVGFENRTNVGTAVIGSEPGNEVIGKFLDHYRTNDFIDSQGLQDTTTNVKVLERILVAEHGLRKVDERQELGSITVLPRRTFSPKRIGEGDWDISRETYAVHHMSGSWLTQRERRRGTSRVWRGLWRPVLRRCRRALAIVVGEARARRVETMIRHALR